MKVVRSVQLKPGSYEEILPDFSPEFPYIASYVELHRHIGRQSPWHWHKEVEIFYMEEGELEYDTSGGKMCFAAGSGGFVNSNILHMTKVKEGVKTAVAKLHIFDPLFISGQAGSIIDQKYVMPLTASSGIEIIGLYPDNPEQKRLLELLRRSFELTEEEDAYEIRLRGLLSELWFEFLKMAEPLSGKDKYDNSSGEKIKMMMAFIHSHFSEKISVADIAAAGYVSERECFRIFQECLKMTPVEYMTGYRIQKACYGLAGNDEPVTAIGHACGLGSSSYFGKVFREHIGCTPVEYRRRWRNNDIN